VAIAALSTTVLCLAAPASAQSIVDAQRVEFAPSPDHNATNSDGSAVVQSYALSVSVSGGAAYATADLGKPAPDTDGLIRVNFSGLLSAPLQVGVTYTATVAAVGPGGSAPSTVSNTFALTTTCASTITSSSNTVGPGAATGTVPVTATCAWTALSNDAWLTLTSGASGTGNGTVAYSVAANTLTTARIGSLTIAGNTFTVTQSAACSITIGSTSQSVAAGGGTGSVAVTTASSCPWTAVSNNTPWLTVTSGASGSGNGTVGFSATANTGSALRSGTLTIGGNTFTVNQVACGYTVSPASLSLPYAAATGQITVTTTAGCPWTSSGSVSWLTLTGAATGSGSATYTVTANLTAAARQVTVTVAGKQVPVSQANATPPRPPTALRIIK